MSPPILPVKKVPALSLQARPKAAPMRNTLLLPPQPLELCVTSSGSHLSIDHNEDAGAALQAMLLAQPIDVTGPKACVRQPYFGKASPPARNEHLACLDGQIVGLNSQADFFAKEAERHRAEAIACCNRQDTLGAQIYLLVSQQSHTIAQACATQRDRKMAIRQALHCLNRNLQLSLAESKSPRGFG